MQPRFLNTMHKSSWSSNDYIRVQKQPLKLVFHIISSRDQHKGQISELGDRLEIRCSLHCDFSSGAQDHCSSSDDLGVALQFFNQRDHKRTCFSTTGTSHCDHVEPLEDGWDSFSLDWGGKIVPFRFNSFQDWYR